MNSILTILVFITIISSAIFIRATTTAAAEQKPPLLHHHHDETRCGIPSPSECQLFVAQSVCGLDNPYYCRFPASGGSYKCLSEWDVKHEKNECNGGCFNLRHCGAKQCSGICTEQQCMNALNIGKRCPPNSSSSNSQFPTSSFNFICTAGPLQNQCGLNIGRDQNCFNGSICFDENPRCFDCCDFNSCSVYENCLHVECPKSNCSSNRCDWREPFFCVNGQAANGCSSDPKYFPLSGCTNCCDLTTCDPHPCGVCPEELCGEFAKCPDPMFPVLCQNSTTNPEQIGRCGPYGLWPSSNSCEQCCSCPSN